MPISKLKQYWFWKTQVSPISLAQQMKNNIKIESNALFFVYSQHNISSQLCETKSFCIFSITNRKRKKKTKKLFFYYSFLSVFHWIILKIVSHKKSPLPFFSTKKKLSIMLAPPLYTWNWKCNTKLDLPDFFDEQKDY